MLILWGRAIVPRQRAVRSHLWYRCHPSSLPPPGPALQAPPFALHYIVVGFTSYPDIYRPFRTRHWRLRSNAHSFGVGFACVGVRAKFRFASAIRRPGKFVNLPYIGSLHSLIIPHMIQKIYVPLVRRRPRLRRCVRKIPFCVVCGAFLVVQIKKRRHP